MLPVNLLLVPDGESRELQTGPFLIEEWSGRTLGQDAHWVVDWLSAPCAECRPTD